MTSHIDRGDWTWLKSAHQIGQVVGKGRLWGTEVVDIWLPVQGTMVRVTADQVESLGRSAMGVGPDDIVYIAAAARIADALQGDTLVAPLEGTVIPLPHQIDALSRAMSGDSLRYLLADEVGLGKTIEAGLIMRELKIRGLVKRILVVAPTGLVTQWVSEMRTHFNEDFRLVIPGEFSTWRKIAAVGDTENLWRLHNQVVCPLDSVKPLDSRRGWSGSG